MDEEDLDPSKYTDNRRAYIQNLRDNGINPYPHKFSRTHRIDQFREVFETECTEESKFDESTTVAITGRIKSLRGAGAKLIFIDLEGDGAKVQIMATASHY